MPGYKLLTENAAKTNKGEKAGYLTGILYLQPDEALCPASTPACRAACLVGAGRARIFSAVRDARARRTARFYADRPGFIADLMRDVFLLLRRANAKGLRPALRLNGTSDVSPWVFGDVYQTAAELGIVTYEYTKRLELIERHAAAARRNDPDEIARLPMHYTFSASESNGAEQGRAARLGYGIARVYSLRRSSEMHLYDTLTDGTELAVIDGDRTDLRFLDRSLERGPASGPYIVGLRLKHTNADNVARASGFAV